MIIMRKPILRSVILKGADQTAHLYILMSIDVFAAWTVSLFKIYPFQPCSLVHIHTQTEKVQKGRLITCLLIRIYTAVHFSDTCVTQKHPKTNQSTGTVDCLWRQARKWYWAVTKTVYISFNPYFSVLQQANFVDPDQTLPSATSDP